MSIDNSFRLRGYLGADPIIRTTKNGNPSAFFSVATTKRWKDKEGNQQEQTDWHGVNAYGKTAELIDLLLQKGSHVLLEGEIRQYREDGEGGGVTYRTALIVDQFQKLDKDRKGASASDSSAGEDDGPEDDEDIPF